MSQKAKISKVNFWWSRAAVAALIDVYKKRTCLYDIKSPEYHNREKNRDALEEMVSVVSKYHPEVTENDCKRKYQGLRAQFNREYAKVLKSMKSGAGTEEVLEPKLWCFESLLFLKDSVKAKKGMFIGGVTEEDDGHSSEEDMVVEYLEECEEEHSQSQEREIVSTATRNFSMISPEPGPSNQELYLKRKCSSISSTPSNFTGATKPKRLLKSNSTDTSREQSSSPLESAFMASVSNYLDRKKDTPRPDKSKSTVFGEFIASRLETMKPKLRKKLEKEICELVFRNEIMESDSD